MTRFRMAALALPLAFLADAATPEQRAVEYLSREVPGWSQQFHCYSCHNNGDAARALFLARQRGYPVPDGSLSDTIAWLQAPLKWDENRGNPGVSDKKLARVQFAAALTEAWLTGAIRDRSPVVEAAQTLEREQSDDGSWKIDTGGAPGAPATYSTALATWISRRTLESAGTERFAQAIARATHWLETFEPANILDTAVRLLARTSVVRYRTALVEAQTSDGGWGPQPKMPAEPFDTALVLLALQSAGGAAESVARGRAFLLAQQQSAGGWPETTRPAGQQSYAEHISTTGWAAYALLATDPKRQ